MFSEHNKGKVNTIVEDMPFKADILHRIQKLEEKSMLSQSQAGQD